MHVRASRATGTKQIVRLHLRVRDILHHVTRSIGMKYIRLFELRYQASGGRLALGRASPIGKRALGRLASRANAVGERALRG